ncbi:MAG: NTP transferase domain-containing protein, partial [Halocynthiibacter sp.]
RAGVAALSPECSAVIIALADMPDLTPAHYNDLISAHSTGSGAAIYQAATATGVAGHPVLFSQRYFEILAAQDGDRGARDVLRAPGTEVVAVATRGEGASVDLDTPEAWAEWERNQ